jgi:hypothetical protein
MGNRQDPEQTPRELRAARKKAVRDARHRANQDLRTVADTDDLVVPEPRFDRGPRQAPKSRRLRHWKLKEWKRRTAARRARNDKVAQLSRED